jgi:hypothetical protein
VQAGASKMDVCVHHDAWESATASTLIGAAEAWARADTREGDFMRAFAFEREDYLRQALEDRGYGFIRHHLFMLIELSSEPPDPGWPEGILVRPFRPGDERAVYEADMECLVYAGAGADAAWDRHSCAPPSPSSAGAERHASGSPSTPKT